MKKYVKVKLSDYMKPRIYKIPLGRISPQDIQGCVVVEASEEYDGHVWDSTPYKVAKVIELLDEIEDCGEVKDIVDVIDENSYIIEQINLREEKKNKQALQNFFLNLAYEDQIEILSKNMTNDEILEVLYNNEGE